ncbi:MAG TPA: hypothetical protein VMW87_03745 [Spirochaetia bacterium]|nr:hypothetical protein [Spirochaetia bacterium]
METAVTPWAITTDKFILTKSLLDRMIYAMVVEKVEFESFLPESCPPKEAVPPNLVVIRLVRDEIVSKEDFVPYYSMVPGKDWGNRLCKACGLSVYTDPADVKRAMGVNPALRTFRSAFGRLEPSSGAIQHTPRDGDSHHTWWKNKNVDAERIFIIQ